MSSTYPRHVIFFDATGTKVYETDMHILPRAGEVVTAKGEDDIFSGKVSFVAHNLVEMGKEAAYQTVHIYMEPKP